MFCFGFNHPLHQRLLTTSQTCLSTSQPSQTGETGYHEEPSAETRHRARMYSIAAGKVGRRRLQWLKDVMD